jgi:hypothetical protein
MLTSTAMPPKRRSAPADAPARPRPSKLAREHNISAREESEIREAFTLFSVPSPGEREGLLPVRDVRKTMV